MSASMSASVTYMPPEQGFLGVPTQDAIAPEKSRAVVIPCPLEASVSYGSGTAKGPAAILKASHQIELFDEQQDCEPYYAIGGIATLAPPALPSEVTAALAQLHQHVDLSLQNNQFPLILGGEHTITQGAIAPFLERHNDIAILHFDAHADLRDRYEDNPYSHATALRRCLDHPAVSTLVSCGIRSLSAPEMDYLKAHKQRIHMHFAYNKAQWSIDEIIAPLKGKTVYLTCDIDALDSAIMPATGTPEPGGLTFYEIINIISATAKTAHIVGADINELAPIPGLHACDFLAAKLAYKIISLALLNQV